MCGQKKVVHELPSERTFEAGHSEGAFGSKPLGDYTIGIEGGGYDYSHAETCSRLTDVIEKKELLKSYLGHSNLTKADFCGYHDYEKLLSSIGVSIKKRNVRKVGKYGSSWKVQLSLLFKGALIANFKSVAEDTMERAFSELRHRLLCGEVLQFNNERWQVIASGDKKPPSLKKLKNAKQSK